jgi:hypothetical protein
MTILLSPTFAPTLNHITAVDKGSNIYFYHCRRKLEVKGSNPFAGSMKIKQIGSRPRDERFHVSGRNAEYNLLGF